MNIQEGYMPYLGYQTYYRIAGNLHSGRNCLSCCCTVDLALHTTILRRWTPWRRKLL